MTELLIIAGAAVAVACIADHAFHSWLQQRERERLSATDKAVLEKRLDEVDSRIRDVKSSVSIVKR